jgi:hypothetical protein
MVARVSQLLLDGQKVNRVLHAVVEFLSIEMAIFEGVV